MKIGDALRAALTGAVGMVGMNLTTDMLVAQMEPATTAMVERLGWNLDIVDTGWSLMSYAWGSPVGGLLILVGIGLNLLLLATNFTKTLMIDFGITGVSWRAGQLSMERQKVFFGPW